MPHRWTIAFDADDTLWHNEKFFQMSQERSLNCRQAAVSQMLARLRDDGMVATRRDGKTIYYSLADDNTAKLIDLLYNMFCSVNAKDAAQ